MMCCENIRLLTLNAHSLVADDGEASASLLAEVIFREDLHLVALQEANQPKNGEYINVNSPKGVGIPVKNGNYMQKVAENLNKYSHEYKSFWYGFKEGYGYLEEGVGIITKLPVEDIKMITLSSGKERVKWKRRCALGVKTPYGDFFSTHMGWWYDNDEPFLDQWGKMCNNIENKKTWILGDFNAESHKTKEGYDCVVSNGFFDTYTLAEKRDSGYTVCEKIDGWQDSKNRRIDYIFCNFPCRIKFSKTVFNGNNYAVISDHFGVMVEAEVGKVVD